MHSETWLGRIANYLESYLPITTEFRPVLYAFALVTVPSSVLLVPTTLDPSLFVALSDSRSTPWGVITSIFVHSGIFHLAGNAAVLLAIIILFVKMHQFRSMEDKHSRSVFFLWNIFF